MKGIVVWRQKHHLLWSLIEKQEIVINFAWLNRISNLPFDNELNLILLIQEMKVSSVIHLLFDKRLIIVKFLSLSTVR